MDRFLNVLGLIFGIIGNILFVLLLILLAVLLLVTLVCLSRPKLILKLKDSLEISVKLWFIKLNITKMTSKPKKKKKVKIIHFDGTLFGELPPKAEKKSKKKSKKASLPATKKQGQKDADNAEKTKKGVGDYLGLATDILDGIKEPAKKILKVDIKRLYLIAADQDPAKAAVLFGNMNIAAGTLIFVCEKFAAFTIDSDNTGVYSDFTASKHSFDAHIELTLSLRHIVLCGIKAGLTFLGFIKEK